MHMKIEEELVYPLVEREVGHEEAEEAAIEHNLARNGLKQLHELVDKPGFGAVVDMVTAGIKHHVKEEEQEIFPELKRDIPREALADLGDRVVVMKGGRPAARAAKKAPARKRSSKAAKKTTKKTTRKRTARKRASAA